jgi:hypothetical protein
MTSVVSCAGDGVSGKRSLQRNVDGTRVPAADSGRAGSDKTFDAIMKPR